MRCHFTFQCTKRAYNQEEDGLFLIVTGQGRMNSLKLMEWKFRLDINKKFCTQGMVRQWHGTPREVVDFPSLEKFKVQIQSHPGLSV